LNTEIELFGVFEFVEDWFATNRYWPLLSTSVYTGFAAGERFAVGPPRNGIQGTGQCPPR